MTLFKHYNIKIDDHFVSEIVQNKETLEFLKDYHKIERDCKDEVLDYFFFTSYEKFTIDSFLATDEEMILFEEILKSLKDATHVDKGSLYQKINRNYTGLSSYNESSKNELLKVASAKGINTEVQKYLIENFTLDFMRDEIIERYINTFKRKPELLELLFEYLIKDENYLINANSLVSLLLLMKAEALVDIVSDFEKEICLNFSRVIERNLDGSSKDEKFYTYFAFFKNFSEYLKLNKSKYSYQFDQLEEQVESKYRKVISERGESFGVTFDSLPILDRLSSDIENNDLDLMNYTHTLKDDKLVSIFEGFNNFKQPLDNIFAYQGFYNSPRAERELRGLTFETGRVFHHLLYHELDKLERLINVSVKAIDESYAINDSYFLKTDVSVLFLMIDNVLNTYPIPKNQDEESAAFYGLTMYTCALIEKTLRNYYLYSRKDFEYIDPKNLSLNALLSDKSIEIVKLLGIDQVNVIRHYLIGDENSNGHNIRNSLAHLTKDSQHMISNKFVAVFTLFVSVISSITINIKF